MGSGQWSVFTEPVCLPASCLTFLSSTCYLDIGRHVTEDGQQAVEQRLEAAVTAGEDSVRQRANKLHDNSAQLGFVVKTILNCSSQVSY